MMFGTSGSFPGRIQSRSTVVATKRAGTILQVFVDEFCLDIGEVLDELRSSHMSAGANITSPRSGSVDGSGCSSKQNRSWHAAPSYLFTY
eukprot:scaffold3414_cov113-Isochrysis_galbana.AAC.2